jgi:rhamnosyltransferase subunit B
MSQFGIKKRVVFSTWGSFGDLHPFMALALELQARGYQSVIATSPLYREKVEAEGIAFHSYLPRTCSKSWATSKRREWYENSM